MLSNAYSLAKFRFDTAENERAKRMTANDRREVRDAVAVGQAPDGQRVLRALAQDKSE